MTAKADALFEQRPWLLDHVEIPSVTVRNPNSKWRMSSTWQKAIRRGDKVIAQKMLAGLISVDTNYAFRRIGVIAVEDIGLASYDVVMAAQAVSKLPVDDPRRIKAVVNMTLAMCDACKSRAACDLSVSVMGRKYFDPTHVVTPDDDISALCVEVWKVFGTRKLRGTDDMPLNSGVGKDIGSTLETMGMTTDKVNDLMELANKSGMWGMPAAWGALILAGYGEEIAMSQVADDVFPPVEMIGAYPSYAFDQHCMEGKRAIAYFRAACPSITEWFQEDGIPNKEDQMPLLCEAIFCADSGLLSNRSQAPVEQVCLDLSKTHVFNSVPSNSKKHDTALAAANSLITLVLDRMPELNKARRKVAVV
jgi:hypothetical protein